MHKLVQLDEPPFYLPIHRSAVEAAWDKGQKLIKTVEEYGDWSDDIYIDEKDN